MTLTVGSLFSGIGGLDLGLERAGMRVLWQVEIDPYAQKVLAQHWPAVARYGDIRGVSDPEPVDVLAGGYPCQGNSFAGKRAGHADPRSGLWSEFARLITALHPRYVLIENVPGILAATRRTDGGMDPAPLHAVLTDLAACGYDAEWQSLPAAAVGAPHLRDRVWIVGYRTASVDQGTRGERGLLAHAALGRQRGDQDESHRSAQPRLVTDPERSSTALAYAHPGRRPGWAGEQWATGRPESAHGGQSVADSQRDGWQQSPEVFCGRQSFATLRREISGGWWVTEPGVGRVAHGVSKRVDRLRGLGNAVVPQAAECVGRCIVAHAQQLT